MWVPLCLPSPLSPNTPHELEKNNFKIRDNRFPDCQPLSNFQYQISNSLAILIIPRKGMSLNSKRYHNILMCPLSPNTKRFDGGKISESEPLDLTQCFLTAFLFISNQIKKKTL